MTGYLGAQTYSVTTTLIPSAISLAIAMWLVIRDTKLRQGPRQYLAGVIIFVGAIMSFVASSLYLDNIRWFPRFAAESELAVAAALGATCFATSVALSCVRLRFKTVMAGTVGTFVTFSITAFTALIVLDPDSSNVSPHLLSIIFLCSACIQAVVIITTLVVTRLLLIRVSTNHANAVEQDGAWNWFARL